MTLELTCDSLQLPSDLGLDLSTDFRFLFFIGSGRTGSTLFGQILNFHPNCLISNESRFLERVLKKKTTIELAFQAMCRDARHQFDQGLEHSNHYRTSIAQYQPRWKPMSGLHAEEGFLKRIITVIGDKKAGGATKALRRHKEPFEALLAANSNVYLLQMIRDPATAALSYLRSHQIPTFEEACEKVIKDTATAHQLSSLEHRYRHVFYEDLLDCPEEQVTDTCRWLGLPAEKSWIEKIVSVVDRTPSLLPAHQRRVANRLLERENVSILRRYRTE